MNYLIYQCCFPLQRHPTSITWTCALKNKKARCYATVRQTGDTSTAGNRDHCHQSNPGTLVRHQVAAAVKAGARENVRASAMSIVERELLTLPDNAANLPDPNLLKRRANRTRQAMRPKHPRNLDFELDPDHLPPGFLQEELRVDDERHFILSTPTQLELLSRATTWYIDGTFKVVGEPFAQLLSIHAFVQLDENVKQVPLLFCLMSRRTKKDYKAVFRTVQALINEEGYGDPVVQQVVTDFEKAIWQGVRATFRAVEVRGCAFHWAQAVWRKIQDLGLATAYREHQDVGPFLRKVFGLPFLPREHIPATFDHLSTLARNSECHQIVQLLDYVDDTWLRSETWDIGSWCVYRRSVRTNNDVEGWHHRINQRAGRKPDLYQLIGHLHDEAKLVPLQVRLLLDGHVIREQRKSTRTTQTRTYRIWDEYERRSKGPMSLLSAIGHVYRPWLQWCADATWGHRRYVLLVSFSCVCVITVGVAPISLGRLLCAYFLGCLVGQFFCIVFQCIRTQWCADATWGHGWYM